MGKIVRHSNNSRD